LDNAPLYSDVAEGPEGGKAYWVTARDGVRLRVAAWAKGTKGTVLLMPGRTEYVEKYGRIAGDLAAEGFAMMAIDWREKY
jgi:lysophospholipase